MAAANPEAAVFSSLQRLDLSGPWRDLLSAVIDSTAMDLLGRLEQCLPIDRMRLGNRVRSVKSHDDDALRQIIAEIEAAERRAHRRRSGAGIDRSAITIDPALPIAACRDEIASAIAGHHVVVVCGETGSGKTTQLPKICLQIGRGVTGMIGHTQPRRIAARSVAARIAHELGSPISSTRAAGPVGYSVRFTDRTNPDTLIKVMTDGILLAEVGGRDRLLLQYDTLIIDEAHERSLNIDFLLGYIKTLLLGGRRPDLKVIITSATIDPRRFSAHFSDAPIIEVSGRGFPVDVRYQPMPSGTEPDEDDPVMLEAIAAAVDETGRDPVAGEGDALVFLSGEREIREAAKFLKGRLPADHEILPLYARLSSDEQNRVFEPHSGRRIVLATNVAETSLTVPGIRSVIDPGLARISRYSPASRVQRLPIERISQASAKQRAGRCGRIAPGVCIRLYSETEFDGRPAFTDPEILRSNLASVILQMKSLRLGRIEEFPFIDRPRASSVREGLQTLYELNALDDSAAGDLTEIGRRLARLPIDPRFGRMVLEAQRQDAVREVLIIVSALAAQDPRLRPFDKSALADAAHAEFLDERSDFLSFIKLWEWWQAQSQQRSSNQLRKLCEAKFVSFIRMREWADLHRQLHALAMSAGMKSNPMPARYDTIHRALLSGLLGNVGMKTDTYEYQGVSDRKFVIFPGSVLFRNQPRWIMAAEIVETTRLYARIVARIHPEWIEGLAPHLIKRSHSAPYWNRQTSHVEANERITLRGLTIVPKRRVHFGRIDLPLARETFIQHALVEGDYRSPSPRHASDTEAGDALQHNRALIAHLRDAEHKARRRDLLVGPEAMYAFYDSRLPPDVCNGPAFEKWLRKAQRRNPEVLHMHREDVLSSGAALVDPAAFPDSIDVGGTKLPLEYRHEPGHADDGVTLIVPAEGLRQLREERLAWLVPGLLAEKIASLIKGLPKGLRVSFIPVPEVAATVSGNIPFGIGVLTDSIARDLERSTGVHVPRDAWRADSVPEHLRINIRVVDGAGQPLASGRDLRVLQSQLAATASDVLASPPTDERFRRTGLTHWDFDALLERVQVSRGGIQIAAYPAIVDEGNTVGVRLFDTAECARRASQAGIRRLFALQVREELAMHVEYLPAIEQICLHFAPLAKGEEIRRDVADLIVDRVFLRDDAEIRSGDVFRNRLDAGWDQLWPAAAGVADLVARIAAAYHDVELRVSGAEDNQFLRPAIDDIKSQMRELMPEHFLVSTPWRWLAEFPRFLNAIVIRLQKLTNAGAARDIDATRVVDEFWQSFADRRALVVASGGAAPALDEFRWLIEELRVSLFAQELRTSVPISAKRLQRAWEALS